MQLRTAVFNHRITKVGNQKRKREFIFLIVLFRIIIDVVYRDVISVWFEYARFYNHETVQLHVLSWIILCAAMFPMYRAYANEAERLSYEIITILFLMSFVPFTSMVAFGAYSAGFIFANSCYWFLLLSLNLNQTVKITGIRFSFKLGRNRIIGETQLMILSIVFAIVTLYVSGRYAHFRLNFNLLEVYEYRSEAAANDLPVLLNYLFAWSQNLNSILIAYFVRRKKYPWVAFSIVVQLLSFGYDGSKSTLFLVLLAVFISILPSFELRTMNKWILRGICAISIFCYLVFLVTHSIVPISIMIRRVFYMPALLAGDYFDYFSTHTPDFFRRSFMRHFGLSSPYSKDIAFIIGNAYFGNEMGANSGLISDAMANLGYVGIIVFPVLITIVLRLLDKSAQNLDPRIYATVAVYIALVLTNSFLFAVLLTHGLAVTIILLSFMKRNESYSLRAGPNC